MSDYQPVDPLGVPEPADEEPWTYRDDLAPARGCLLGILLGLAFWALLIAAVVIAWRLE